MRFPRIAFATITAAALLSTGCGGGSEDFVLPTSSVSAPASAAPAKPSVNLRHYNATCADPAEFCDLPVQFEPKIVPGESVTRPGLPKQDDTVTVLCWTTGEKYRDGDGNSRTRWYGIKVTKKLRGSNPGKNRRPVKINGGYLGFVQDAWIKGVDSSKLTQCSKYVK